MGKSGRKILFALASVLAFNSYNSARAEESRAVETRSVDDSLIEDMRKTVYENYDKVKNNLESKIALEMEIEFLKAAKRHGIPIKRWQELEKYFEQNRKYLLVADMKNEHGEHANVIFAELVSKTKEQRKVNGKELIFDSVVIKNPLIKDSTRYLSNGRYANPALTFKNTVIHNMDVYGISAERTYACLKHGLRPFGEFDYRIREAEWRELYRKVKSKKEFVERCIELMIDEANIHESYHMSVRGTELNTDDNDEEIRARYFTFINSPLRQGVFIREAYALFNLPETSKEYQVSRTIFNEFVEYIKKEQIKGKFKKIQIKEGGIKEQVQNLHLLTNDEIKEIAKKMYEKSY